MSRCCLPFRLVQSSTLKQISSRAPVTVTPHGVRQMHYYSQVVKLGCVPAYQGGNRITADFTPKSWKAASAVAALRRGSDEESFFLRTHPRADVLEMRCEYCNERVRRCNAPSDVFFMKLCIISRDCCLWGFLVCWFVGCLFLPCSSV